MGKDLVVFTPALDPAVNDALQTWDLDASALCVDFPPLQQLEGCFMLSWPAGKLTLMAAP